MFKLNKKDQNRPVEARKEEYLKESLKEENLPVSEDAELDDESLEKVAGGLNPQPIPPGRSSYFAGPSGTGKTGQW
ncbi:MAG TPA: hypothetical protein VH186_00260 [Chloroflexia bacterium]|nr:hypothetical protein [Chloroflexia bacterium]